MRVLRTVFYSLSTILVFCCAAISIWWFYDRIFSEPYDSPYRHEWPRFLIMFLIFTFTGFTLLKTTRKLVITAMLCNGLMMLLYMYYTFSHLSGAPVGGQEEFLYASISLAHVIIFAVIVAALRMKYNDLK